MLLGFQTGVLYKFVQPTSKEVIRVCQELGGNAIELNASRIERINFLKQITKSDIKGFKYISIHGPRSEFMDSRSAPEQKKILGIFQSAYERLHYNCLIFHPGEWLIKKGSILKKYSLPVAIENMDWRNKFGISVKDIHKILRNTDFKFVLDLNHCYTHDKTMKLAQDFYNNFKDRISHFHLSGFGGSKNDHIPLYKTKQLEIIKAIPNLDLPIMLESVCKNIEEAKKEIEYVRSVLSRKM